MVVVVDIFQFPADIIQELSVPKRGVPNACICVQFAFALKSA